MGWLCLAMVEGARERSQWTDPVLIGFILFFLMVLIISIRGIKLFRRVGATINLYYIFRKIEIDRTTASFYVVESGTGRGRSQTVVVNDGKKEHVLAFYWVFGQFLAPRAASRLKRTLIES